ncbi:hypothetical protein [Pseudomonas sp. PIC25]|uniref:hypothetical protein n=1 Tax=Pseudomonas sp. PIC25 TaxID=1958773 RepID=UPI00117AD409|nr:hypothetical protein [Pseudomonas sp. PIC25]
MSFDVTNNIIGDELAKVGVTVSRIKSGEVFYTGFYRGGEETDNHAFLESRYAIWLSRYLPYAGEYSYRQSSYPIKKIAKIKITEEILVMEFPLNFHPADCFFEWSMQDGRYVVDYMSHKPGMIIDGYQPDHHFDKHFYSIVSLLGIQERLSGFIRRALPGERRFAAGEIVEFALTDYKCKEIVAIADVPKEKSDFMSLVEEHGDSLENIIFG